MQKYINTVDTDGNPIELIVTKPTAKQNSDAQIIYSREWLKSEANGCPLRAKVEEISHKHGLWSDECEKQKEALEKEIIDLERKLRAGSKFYKTKAEAKEVALRIRKLRGERMGLLNKRSVLNEHTAEAHAENARTNYLISVCVVYSNNGKQFFRDMGDYLERSSEKAAVDATQAFIELLYADLLDFEKKYYENQWLLQQGFVDDKFRLINKDGKLVDSEGRLIDENGRYINENGKFVDSEGNEVDENGDPVIEFVPFDE